MAGRDRGEVPALHCQLQVVPLEVVAVEWLAACAVPARVARALDGAYKDLWVEAVELGDL